MSKPQKGAAAKAPKKPGNITVDLGEAIDKKLRAAIGSAKSEARTQVGYGYGQAGRHRPIFGGRFGRPVLGSGYGRPFGGPSFAGRFNPSMGGTSILKGVQSSTSTLELLGGIGVGVVVNRSLMRLTPAIVKVNNEAAHAAIAFVVGLIPAIIKQNSITVGVAIPGAVALGASLVDWAMNAIGIQRPSLSGGASRQGVDAALAARQRLADIQARLSAPRTQQVQGAQRVVARVG